MSVGCLAEEANVKPAYSVSLDESVACLVNKQKKFGILKFIGETEFSAGVWYGIELSEPCGRNDGTVAGKRYFKCAENYGIFVNSNNVYPAKFETRSILNTKQMKRRVLPNVVQESCPVPFDNLCARNRAASEHVLTTKPGDDNVVNDIEARPRSKSDNGLEKEGTNKVFHFSNSPFKCDVKEGKMSSIPKLNNATYICQSPIIGSTANTCTKEDFRHPSPSHSSPLLESQSESCKNDQEPSVTENACKDSVNEGSSSEKTSISGHHHVQLSPHFEVKQSIKIGHIGSIRFSSSSLKGQESSLNKTFLIRKDSLQGKMKDKKQKKMVDPSSEAVSVSNEKKKNIKNLEKRGTVSKTQQLSKIGSLNCTFVSTCESESDGCEVRSRSVSKSSLSSVESFSSVGSTETSKAKNRLKSTGTSKELSSKLPLASEASKSKSKLVKIFAESKVKSKSKEKVACGTAKGIPVPKSSEEKPKTNEVGLIKKNRTKSTSVFGNGTGSVLKTPGSVKTNIKPKSKSVSSDYSTRVTLSKGQVSTPKVFTALRSKMSESIATRRLTSTPLHSAKMAEKKTKVKASGTKSANRKPSVSVIPNNRVKVERILSQESNKSENNSATRQIKKKEHDDEKRPTKQEDDKVVTRTRNVSTSRAESGNSKNSGVKSSTVKSLRGNENLSAIGQGLRPRKVSEKSGERGFLKKKVSSEVLINGEPRGDKVTATEGNLASCLTSAFTPDLLKQTPEATRQSVGVQVGQDNLEHEDFSQSLADQFKNEREKVESLLSQLSRRNRDFEAILIALQVYSKKVDNENKNVEHLIKCIELTKKKCLNAEKKIVKESSYRVRLEDEMLSVKSDSVVELALLKAEFERKQDLIQDQLVEDFEQDLEKAKRRHAKTMEEVKRSCDLKLKRVEETYVQDIAQINENHKDDIANLELQHSKDIEELVEERHAEIETIKEDYEEQMEQLKNLVSETGKKCCKLAEKLRFTEEESKRDIELRIQDAIAEYKTLPDELESMKFVLEMKNNEMKKLRHNNMQLQNQIDELQRVKNRAVLLEREKESLNFVVENKVHFERQLSQERDKLRRNLDREVAASKRLSLENEELTWRLNSYQNSPTSPTFDRVSWRMSGFSSPDSAVYSQRIEESDLELRIDTTEKASN